MLPLSLFLCVCVCVFPQLVGITSILLASKYEEIYAPAVRDLVFVSARAYTREEILRMETTMLNTLKFQLTVRVCACVCLCACVPACVCVCVSSVRIPIVHASVARTAELQNIQ